MLGCFASLAALVLLIGRVQSSRYIGCYQDNVMPSLRGVVDPLLDNSELTCSRSCSSKSYRYAGLYKGNMCLCSNYGPANAGEWVQVSTCNLPCIGNPNQVCGGVSAISFYDVALDTNVVGAERPVYVQHVQQQPAPLQKPIVFVYPYKGKKGKKSDSSSSDSDSKENRRRDTPRGVKGTVDVEGCWKDSKHRLLGDYKVYLNWNTPTACVQTCQQKSYVYAGVQGFMCFCSNNIPTKKDMVKLKKCRKSCPQDKNQYCGGKKKTEVYKINY